MTASRIFNYSHFLSGFKYTIEYLSTTTHGNADFLSRFPITEISENNDYDDHEQFMIGTSSGNDACDKKSNKNLY